MNASKDDGEDWETVAQAIRSRRAFRQLTQQELATLAKLGVQTIRNIEAGKSADRRDATLNPIESALGWPLGTIRQLATGSTTTTPEYDARLRALEDAVPLLRTRLDRLVNHLGNVSDVDDDTRRTL